MSEIGSVADKSVAISRSRRWLVPAFFVCWTALAALAVWWLTSDAARTGDTVLRINPGEAKAWNVRLRETIALARLNFPWALAWIALAPYALWIGARFHFEGALWKGRLAILLASGIFFIWASQWLAQRLSAGQTMLVVVNYQGDTTMKRIDPSGGEIQESFSQFSRAAGTNRYLTNKITKVMISGDTATRTNWQTTEILSALPTNFPHMLAGAGANFPPPDSLRRRQWSAPLDGFAYIALIGLAHAGVFHRRYRERERQASLLESRLNQAQLRALQAQLQPHFLFNTLNGIATLVRRDPAAAHEMLLALSELLRIALNSSHRQEIPLREELDFLDRYLAIQRMRFGDRMEVTREIEAPAMDCLVPALLLQPLVENAIRHGLEPSGKPGKLRIAGSRNGEWFKLTVEDNGVGLPPGGASGAGVGLANVRERLNTLYGGAHDFNIAERPEGGVIVSIKLPARMEGAPPHPSFGHPLPQRGRGQGEGTGHEEENLS